MQYTAEERAMIWLDSLPQIEYRGKIALLRAAKDPAALLGEWEKFSAAVIKDGKGRVYNIDRVSRERQAEELVRSLDEKGYFAISLVSEDYPESLKAIPDPPLVLYGAGRRELLKRRRFCIVGSRITPPWAEKQARTVSEKIASRFVVVTGLAEGGDRAAIDGALDGGDLISVLPCGLDHCYPRSHASLKEKIASRGLLLSEYPPDTPSAKYYFPARNRLLAGLSEGVLVVSAREKRSGALITAGYAAEYGRDVFAFPYNIGIAQGAGCNELIKKGAYLTTGAEDILSAYGMEAPEEQRVSLTQEERLVAETLREHGELHAAKLAQLCRMSLPEAMATLASLEIKNIVVKSGGNRYSAL